MTDTVASSLRFGAALSTALDPAEAAGTVAAAALERLDGADPSIAVLVASRAHARSAETILDVAREEARAEHVIGCVAEVVVGGHREVDGGPAVSMWLATLPEAAETFDMQFVRTSEGGVLAGYPIGSEPGPYLMLGDPFSFPMDHLLDYVNERVPGTPVMGGMATGGMGPGETRLFLDDRVLGEGAVGARLPGVRIESLVSQGCRPIGSVFTVTRAEGNLIHELGGHPPMERIQEMVARLDPHERDLVQHGLHIGRVIDPYKAEPVRGDFLVRGVIGSDPETGAIAVGDHIEVGEAVQFHVRDATTADEDLRELLDRAREMHPAGALLFTCNGRGTRLFDEADHDAALVSDMLGDPPLAGLNCAGEIGPIGGRNFLHGFTASIALFGPSPELP
jgi:small ligand-binding sensory domain FIST